MLLSGLRLSSASKARYRRSLRAQWVLPYTDMAHGRSSTLQTWAETIAFRSRTTAPTKLYSAWFCPYSQCTFAQLEELADHGFTYQYIEIDPYKPRPDGLDSKQKLSIEEKRKKYPVRLAISASATAPNARNSPRASCFQEFVKASPQGLVPAMTHKRASVWGCADCSLYLVDLLERNPSLSTTTGGKSPTMLTTFFQLADTPCSTQEYAWTARGPRSERACGRSGSSVSRGSC
eukprot:2040550-Rhodomonas_salina.1